MRGSSTERRRIRSSVSIWLRRTLFLTCIVASVVVLAAPQRTLPAVACWLCVGEGPRPADYVLALPGDSEARPFVAAGMLRRGLARGVLIPRAADSPDTLDGIYPPDHEVSRRVMLARGVREEQLIFLPRVSASTWGDARSLADFLADHPGAMVAVVTSDYHTRRSRWVFHRVLGKDADRVFFVSAPGEFFACSDWWQSAEGLRTCLGEYSKYGIYRLQSGDPIAWSLSLLSLLGTIWLLRPLARTTPATNLTT